MKITRQTIKNQIQEKGITQHPQEGQEVELKESEEKSEVKGTLNRVNKSDLNWYK